MHLKRKEIEDQWCWFNYWGCLKYCVVKCVGVISCVDMAKGERVRATAPIRTCGWKRISVWGGRGWKRRAWLVGYVLHPVSVQSAGCAAAGRSRGKTALSYCVNVSVITYFWWFLVFVCRRRRLPSALYPKSKRTVHLITCTTIPTEFLL